MVSKVLCIIHGARQDERRADDWMVPLELKLRGEADYQVVHRIHYGWTSGVAFRFPIIGWFVRRNRTRLVQTTVAGLHEKYPGARIDVIAYSAGTWFVQYSMLRGAAENRTSLGRVVYFASIVDQMTDWTDVPVERLLNCYSPADKVVRRLPGFGEAGNVGFLLASSKVVNLEMPGYSHGDYTLPGPAWEAARDFLV